MNLINRRFTPFYYDVAAPESNAGDGWAFDPAAVAVIDPMFRGPEERRWTRRGGGQAVSGKVSAGAYPAAVFLTAAGEKIDRVLWGILPPEKFLQKLKAVMARHADLFTADEAEKSVLAAADSKPTDAAAQRDAARLLWELAEWEACLAHVERGLLALEEKKENKDKQKGAALEAELLSLRGRVGLCQHRPDPAAAALKAALPLAREHAPALVDDVLVAMGRSLMQRDRFAEAEKLYRGVIEQWPESDRVGEAFYYAGLALHRLGKTEAAKEVWREHRKRLPRDRMARRSAASLGLPESHAFLNQELLEREGWW